MPERTPHEILAAQVKGEVDDPLCKALWQECPCLGSDERFYCERCQSTREYLMAHDSSSAYRCTLCVGTSYVLRSREEAWYRLPEAVVAAGWWYQIDKYLQTVTLRPKSEGNTVLQRTWGLSEHPLDALCAAISKAKEGVKS